ncbi:MAG: hypothetical protein ACYCTI_11590 [Acidimicrobiales bacterium]
MRDESDPVDGTVEVGVLVEVGLVAGESLELGAAPGSVVAGSEGATGRAGAGLVLSSLGTTPVPADAWTGVLAADPSPLLSKISTGRRAGTSVTPGVSAAEGAKPGPVDVGERNTAAGTRGAIGLAGARSIPAITRPPSTPAKAKTRAAAVQPNRPMYPIHGSRTNIVPLQVVGGTRLPAHRLASRSSFPADHFRPHP